MAKTAQQTRAEEKEAERQAMAKLCSGRSVVWWDQNFIHGGQQGGLVVMCDAHGQRRDCKFEQPLLDDEEEWMRGMDVRMFYIPHHLVEDLHRKHVKVREEKKYTLGLDATV